MKKLCLSLVCYISCFFSFAQIQEYNNPILAGFYPDPSICKAGDAYYLVNSTFAYFPGLPVFKSYDLVHWKQIGNVIDRPSQMNFEGQGVSRGLFAPAIRFNNGIFYATCTMVDGKGNFVVTAKDPAGPWSDPVWLPEINGIDPSLFFDNDKAYIIYNSIPPNNISLYDGHRTIRINEFDAKHLKVLGSNTILVNGGTDLSRKPSWIEGPHLFKKDGKYILIAAQGGTGANHSEVAFKSDKVEGPYIPYNKNPILMQRESDNSIPYPITSTGHADLVETEQGKWQAVFLACRPYETDYYNTGRETFLAPVSWNDGWPIINPEQNTVQYRYSAPLPIHIIKEAEQFAGNFSFRDDFNSSELKNGWLFLRAPKNNWYRLFEKPGSLCIRLQSQTCAQKENPSFIGRRQQHINSTATTSMHFNCKKENEKAGLLIFQNETHYYFICQSIQNNKPCIQLYKSGNKTEELVVTKNIDHCKNIQLKIESKEQYYSFYYSTNNKDWHILAKDLDAKFLSTKISGGFVGCLFALYATSNGMDSNNKAYFDWFEYAGKDEVFSK
jgi:alpha-N-arabinofuranosidase